MQRGEPPKEVVLSTNLQKTRTANSLKVMKMQPRAMNLILPTLSLLLPRRPMMSKTAIHLRTPERKVFPTIVPEMARPSLRQF